MDNTFFFSFFGLLFPLFFIFIFTLSIVGTIFWIVMLIDVVQRKFKNENDKILWVLILLFTGFIGAIIYYFLVVKNKTGNSKKLK